MGKMAGDKQNGRRSKMAEGEKNGRRWAKWQEISKLAGGEEMAEDGQNGMRRANIYKCTLILLHYYKQSISKNRVTNYEIGK